MSSPVVPIPKECWGDQQVFWKSFRPVGTLSVFSGYLQHPLTTREEFRAKKWYKRWPSLLHVLLLVIYIAIFSYRLPSPYWGFANLGSTERTTYVTYHFINVVCPWCFFIFMQRKISDSWKIIYAASAIDVQFNLSVLRRASTLLVILCLAAVIIIAIVIISDVFVHGDGTLLDVVNIVYVLFYCHCTLITYSLPTLIAFLAIVIRETLKEINCGIIEKCTYLRSQCDKNGQVKVTLMDLMEKLCCTFRLVKNISHFYGIPMLALYLILVFSTTTNVFYVLLTGSEGKLITSVTLVSIKATYSAILIALFTIVSGSIPEEATTSLPDLIRVCALEKTSDCKAQIKGLIKRMNGPPVQMTAANFFAINRGLVTSITGAVTTYLIVLVQFEGAESEGSHVTTPSP